MSRWSIALVAPLVLAPLWCYGIGDQFRTDLGTISGLVLILLLLTSAVTDLVSRKIYNWATYSATLWALLINAVATLSAGADGHWTVLGPLGAIGIRGSLLGLVGCFVVMLVVYWLARGGAGDVKLAAAIGALVGFETGILAIAATYIFAGVAISGWTIWTHGPGRLITALGRLLGGWAIPAWISPPSREDQRLLGTPVPLAGFFAIGTIVVVAGAI